MDRFCPDIATLRDLRDERAAEAYNTAYELEDERRRREWEAEFDAIPYRSNGADIHRALMARIKEAA